MTTWTKLYLIYLRTIQNLGFGRKTYNLFRKINNAVYRKGHYIVSPSKKQIKEIEKSTILSARIDKWEIMENSYMYSSINENDFPLRKLSDIDTIVIGATDNLRWSASDMFDMDTSKDNDITPEEPLPGIACHIFINNSGLIERTNSYTKILPHTAGVNTRSISIMLQHSVTGNTMPPPLRVINALEKTLVMLCLQFKLSPLKAIKSQKEVNWAFVPYLKGHKKTQKVSPGKFVFMDELRKKVLINMQRKLHHIMLYKSRELSEMNKGTALALNKFRSNAIELLYKKATIEIKKGKVYG